MMIGSIWVETTNIDDSFAYSEANHLPSSRAGLGCAERSCICSKFSQNSVGNGLKTFMI